MFTDRVLVPLDGSEHSEAILWDLRRLLHGPGADELRHHTAKITLLRVIRPFRRQRDDERHGAPATVPLRLQAARRHLEPLVRQLQAEGFQTECKVLLGDPASVIVRRAEGDEMTLVAMATHGRRGPSRWILGSVAERVLRHCPVPVFLCNPHQAEERKTTPIERVLIPLDGSELASKVIPHVAELAGRQPIEAILLRAAWAPQVGMIDGTPFSSYALPPTAESLQASLQGYESQLGGAKVRFRAEFGDPADHILEVIEKERIDLVAMTTHGWTGLDRWAFGSIAEKVLRRCPCPLLIQRVASWDREHLDDEGEEPPAAAEGGDEAEHVATQAQGAPTEE